MNVRAYRLYDQAVKLQLAAEGQRSGKSNFAHADELALASASRQGWDLLCPMTFEATWNGGPRAEDIEIRLEGADVDQPIFVQSQRGEGLLTFYPGYQFKTAGASVLWLRGPLNTPKDGLYPLESSVDAALLPCTVTMQWQFTRPYHTIRFEAGEPFATIAPYPKTSLETMRVEMVQQAGDVETYEQAFQQMVDSPALHDLFQRLGATPAAPDRGAAQRTDPLPDGCSDTIDGCLDLHQFDSTFFLRERLSGKPEENYLKRYGEVRPREFYVIDALKLVYLSIPKVACTAIKMALAPASGISFEPVENFEYHLHLHPQWHRVAGRLNQAQSGYYRFGFVRNPFDRLVSCYRSKVIFTQSSKTRSPHYHNYFFALPVNISFADFAQRVSKIPDALADAHFKSQYASLYSGGELQVDYLGKFERLEDDWRPIAERYQLDPLLEPANVSKNKPGCYSDYRLYYTEPLVHLVYERYRKDVHAFGYEAEVEQLLAFVREHQQNAIPEVNEGERHMEKELSSYER